jgi:hypothetical protein
MTADTLTAGRKPRLVAGLVMVELADGLLVEGGAERRVLRGRAAVSLIPRLMAAIDGTRTLSDVAATLADVPNDHVHRAVDLLWSLGLIEEAGPDCTNGPLAGYVGRLIGTATGRRQTGEVLRGLDEAEVVVIADKGPARLLARQLDAIGVGETATLPHPALLTRRLALGPWPDLVIVLEGTLDQRILERLDSGCARAGVRWLRTAMNPVGGEVGPLFRANEALCYPCFLAQSTNQTVPRKPSDLLIIEGWAALVAVEVLYILAGIGTTVAAGGQVTTFDFDDWEDRRIIVRPDPTCSSCSIRPHRLKGGDTSNGYSRHDRRARPVGRPAGG